MLCRRVLDGTMTSLNSNIRCIEMDKPPGYTVSHTGLNSNIRCIEMVYYETTTSDEQGWIVTLDVLKLREDHGCLAPVTVE